MSTPAALEQRAAEHIDLDGVRVAAHFGDVAGEYEAARNAVGLAHRGSRALLRISGADHRAFLQGLLSNDVEKLSPGEGCAALFLDTKGHVRAVLDLWAENDAIVVGCEAGFIEDTLPDLAKYVLAADVTIDDLRGSETVLAVVGAAAAETLSRAGAEIPGATAWAHSRAALGGVDVRLARTPDLGAPGVEIHAPSAAVDDIWSALEAAAGEAPVYVGWNVAEALRIEAGVPRLGREVNGGEFPQELLLDDAVDYEKGCYLGQETVARIHYRGQVNRLLSGLRGDSPLPPGAELISSGQEVGSITSAAESPELGSIALAMVRREEVESGATVEVRANGAVVGEARVVSLPIGG